MIRFIILSEKIYLAKWGEKWGLHNKYSFKWILQQFAYIVHISAAPDVLTAMNLQLKFYSYLGDLGIIFFNLLMYHNKHG